MSNIRKIKTILSSSRLFEQSSSRNLSAGKLDSTYYNFMTASYLSNEHLQDSMTFAMTAPLIFQINELKEDVDDLHTHLSESLYTNRETSFGGSILVSSHITASGNISSSGTLLGNSLTLGGTAITSTGTELNIVDGGTVASNITPQDADRVVYNDGGVMRQVTITKLASYFDDEITNMPNLADIGTDLTVAGNITATSLNVTSITSSIVTSSILQTEGSNIFGDTISDTHLFNGHITASGNISSSGTGSFTGGGVFGGRIKIQGASGGDTKIEFTDSTQNIQGTSDYIIIESDNQFVAKADNKVNIDTPVMGVGRNFTTGDTAEATLHLSDTGDTRLLVEGNITASGNISSSGNIIADFPDTNDNALHYPLVTDGNTIEKLNDLNFNPSTGLVQVGGSLQINSTNIVLGTTGTISTTSHITAGGYISSSGAINTLSHITASGNISASGVIYGKQIQHTYHQYNTDSLNTGQYIPAPGGYVIEGTSINYYRQWIAPFNGRLRKLMIYCENDPGNARISLYADGSFVKRKTESFGAATSTNFDFDNPDGGGDSVFTAGQRIAILIDPLNIPGDVNVVCTWEYDINL